jgi:membrane protein YdbS with pleckstrin-like domain
MGFPKKLLGEGETLVLELRPHAKRLLAPVAVLLVVAPVTSFVAARVPDGSLQGWARWALALAAGLVVLRWSVWPFLVWWNTVYVITDRRLVLRQGVLSRRGHDMPLTRLNDVTFSHGVVDRILGCGDLTVESAGERGQLLLDDVPRVEQVQRVLYRLSDVARAYPGQGNPGGRSAAEDLAESLTDPGIGSRVGSGREDDEDPDGGSDGSFDEDPDEGPDTRRSRWGRRR